jgi:hypothetical protein
VLVEQEAIVQLLLAGKKGTQHVRQRITGFEVGKQRTRMDLCGVANGYTKAVVVPDVMAFLQLFGLNQKMSFVVAGGIQATFTSKNGNADAGMGPMLAHLGDLGFPEVQSPFHGRFDLQCSHTNVQALQVQLQERDTLLTLPNAFKQTIAIMKGAVVDTQTSTIRCQKLAIQVDVLLAQEPSKLKAQNYSLFPFLSQNFLHLSINSARGSGNPYI